MNASHDSQRLLALLALGAALLSACQTAPTPPQKPGDPVEGKIVSEQLCASCHAIEAGKPSPNPAAPPFTEVLDRYGARILAEDLENAVSISHLRMPTFHLGDGHGNDIVAYLESMKAVRDKQ